MRWMLVILFLPLLLLILYPAKNSFAQTTASGGLTRVVTDPSGAVVPGAGVEIKDSAKGTTQTTKTNPEGVYQFFFVAPGKYTLEVTHYAFRTESRTINIQLGPPRTANVRLEIAKGSSTVKVTGEASLLQAENGDFASTMSEKQISELPNPGNDLTYITQTTPGVPSARKQLQRPPFQ
jgi:Carboxypeptidase regulatory-like domain